MTLILSDFALYILKLFLEYLHIVIMSSQSTDPFIITKCSSLHHRNQDTPQNGCLKLGAGGTYDAATD